jgi:hypothetical protein
MVAAKLLGSSMVAMPRRRPSGIVTRVSANRRSKLRESSGNDRLTYADQGGVANAAHRLVTQNPKR